MHVFLLSKKRRPEAFCRYFFYLTCMQSISHILISHSTPLVVLIWYMGWSSKICVSCMHHQLLFSLPFPHCVGLPVYFFVLMYRKVVIVINFLSKVLFYVSSPIPNLRDDIVIELWFWLIWTLHIQLHQSNITTTNIRIC